MSHYKEKITAALHDACRRLWTDSPLPAVEKPNEAANGDFSCSIALQLASKLKQAPRQIAENLVDSMALPTFIAKANVAGAGFINFYIKTEEKLGVIKEILQHGKNYGRGKPKQQTVLLEFVSANPTGPLHIGHGRAAAFGDSLANILTFAGFNVWREYYVNDCGRQADILAASVWLRSALGNDTKMPEGSYRGEYILQVADATNASHFAADKTTAQALTQQLASMDDDEAADALVAAAKSTFPNTEVFTTFARDVCQWMLTQIIKKDLQILNVQDFDRWFYESEIHNEQELTASVEKIKQNPDNVHLDADGALWFRTTNFGDDKDRVIYRRDGRPTYFAADIAYHLNKANRTVPNAHELHLLNIFGADHHGYIQRLKAIMQAGGKSSDMLEVLLIQFVSLVENGKRIKMSTRSGQFVPLADLVNMVGADIARYFYVSRKNDQHLDFDLSLAKDKSNANPLYYIQYAHARISRLLETWGKDTRDLESADMEILYEDNAAISLCEKMLTFPNTANNAAKHRAPHVIAVYLHSLAGLAHSFYEKTPVLKETNEQQKLARLALMAATKTLIMSGLSLLGINAPENM